MGGWSNNNRDTIDWDGCINATGKIADFKINGNSVSTSFANIDAIFVK